MKGLLENKKKMNKKCAFNKENTVV